MTARKPLPVLYDCDRCPAYCCTYANIPVEEDDLARLAEHHGMTPEEASRRFTRRGDNGEPRVLRHKRDRIFGTACRFLDLRARRCTIYEARPAICREYPIGRRCGYYEFLKWERAAQEDESAVVTAWVTVSR